LKRRPDFATSSTISIPVTAGPRLLLSEATKVYDIVDKAQEGKIIIVF